MKKFLSILCVVLGSIVGIAAIFHFQTQEMIRRSAKKELQAKREAYKASQIASAVASVAIEEDGSGARKIAERRTELKKVEYALNHTFPYPQNLGGGEFQICSADLGKKPDGKWLGVDRRNIELGAITEYCEEFEGILRKKKPTAADAKRAKELHGSIQGCIHELPKEKIPSGISYASIDLGLWKIEDRAK